MSRINSLERLMFPVDVRPVYTDAGPVASQRKLRVPKRKAVVDTVNGRVLGVVADGYRLVSNEQALAMGMQCCNELFGAETSSSIEVFQVDAPASAGYCHIDLIHNNYVMNLWDEDDSSEVYLPYVRVTNSYNTARALGFDIGFCRKLCLNGCIFERDTVKFSFRHTRSAMHAGITFDTGREQFDAMFRRFQAYTRELQRHGMDFDRAFEILVAVLGIRPAGDIDFDSRFQDREEYESLQRLLVEKLAAYFEDLGANAYALFNTMTDIASHEVGNRYLRRERNTLQRLAGAWVNEYRGLVGRAGFDIDAYIAGLRGEPGAGAERLQAGTRARRAVAA